MLSSVTPRSPPITFKSVKVAIDVGIAPLATPLTVVTPVTVIDDVATLTTDTKIGS